MESPLRCPKIPSKPWQLEDEELLWYASLVHQCVREDRLSSLQATLRKFSKDLRRKIVCQTTDRNAPLFNACLKGHLECVTYLLDECCADIEQKGIYEVVTDSSHHVVTPLWCAAVANRLEVVKALVMRGADINALSDTESTPVRSACYMTNIAVVKFLVDHGANIHKPNVNGGTCLINSVQSVELCEFLINTGARVNDTDNSGNLALHYAIREGRTDTVKLLLRCSADYRKQNDLGDDALQCAGLRGQVDIAQFIIDSVAKRKEQPFSQEKIINTWELLGANMIDEWQDINGAYALWQQAMEWRWQDGHQIPKVLPSETSPAFRHAREPSSVEELQKYIYDLDATYMHSLLIKERILGPGHKDTAFSLMYRGAVYADSHQYQRCVDLWKYALKLRYTSAEKQKHESLFTAQAIVKLFWEMQMEVDADAHTEQVIFADVVDVFKVVISLLELLHSQLSALGEDAAPGSHCVDSQAVGDRQYVQENIHLLLQLCLHIIHLGSWLEESNSDAEKHEFRCLVYHLLQIAPRTCHGESLLHLAVDPKQAMVGDEFYSPLPALGVINMLLDCGADISAVDHRNNMPLHHTVGCYMMSELSDRSILDCLLQRGAHADARNAVGLSPLTFLQEHRYDFCPMKHVTLKCLASCVIVKHGIPYQEEVPPILASFISMH